MNITVTQEFVDRIIARAQASDYGLGEGLTHKQGHLKIDQYNPQDLNALALLLVNGYDEKYDLVSVFRAALELVAQAVVMTADGTLQAPGSSMQTWDHAAEKLRLEFQKCCREVAAYRVTKGEPPRRVVRAN